MPPQAVLLAAAFCFYSLVNLPKGNKPILAELYLWGAAPPNPAQFLSAVKEVGKKHREGLSPLQPSIG